MPIYTFKCSKCPTKTERHILHANYKEQAALGWPMVSCEGCGFEGVERDPIADMRTQYTERAQFYSDLAPEEVAGRGGYSRERKRMLKDAKLVEKGDLPKRAKRVSYRVTESEIRARLDSGQ